jgi:hypothetical protein
LRLNRGEDRAGAVQGRGAAERPPEERGRHAAGGEDSRRVHRQHQPPGASETLVSRQITSPLTIPANIVGIFTPDHLHPLSPLRSPLLTLMTPHTHSPHSSSTHTRSPLTPPLLLSSSPPLLLSSSPPLLLSSSPPLLLSSSPLLLSSSPHTHTTHTHTHAGSHAAAVGHGHLHERQRPGGGADAHGLLPALAVHPAQPARGAAAQVDESSRPRAWTPRSSPPAFMKL